MPSISNEEMAQRLHALQIMPETALKQIWQSVFPDTPMPGNKKYVFKKLVKADCISWQTGNNDEAVKEAKLIKENDNVKTLLSVVQDIGMGTQKYTTLTLKKVIDALYEIPDDEMVVWKGSYFANIIEFMSWFKSKCDESFDWVNEHPQIVLNKFQSVMFTTIPKETHKMMLTNIIDDSLSVIKSTGNSSGIPGVSGYCHIVDVMSKGMMKPENRADTEPVQKALFDRVCPDLQSDDLHHSNIHLVTQHETQEEAEAFSQSVPAAFDTTIAPNETTNQEQTTNEEQTGVASAATGMPSNEAPYRPIVVIDDAETKKLIKSQVGSLMFPSEYRQITISDLTKKSWTKLRKVHKIKGRCEIYIRTNPGENPKQNTALTYNYPHSVDHTWEGAYSDDNGWHTNHPYGTIYLLTQ